MTKTIEDRGGKKFQARGGRFFQPPGKLFFPPSASSVSGKRQNKHFIQPREAKKQVLVTRKRREVSLVAA
jgi:hypothetical protein